MGDIGVALVGSGLGAYRVAVRIDPGLAIRDRVVAVGCAQTLLVLVKTAVDPLMSCRSHLLQQRLQVASPDVVRQQE